MAHDERRILVEKGTILRGTVGSLREAPDHESVDAFLIDADRQSWGPPERS